MSGVGLMTALCSVSLCSVGHRLLATIIDQVITDTFHEIGTSLPSHRPPLSLSMSTMVSSELAISLAKSPNRSVCRGRVLAEAGAGLALSTAVKRIMTSLISPLARARLY